MRLALAIGDAGGVGPELAAKLLTHQDMRDRDVIVLGDARLLGLGARHGGLDLDLPTVAAADLPDRLPAALGDTLLQVRLASMDRAQMERWLSQQRLPQALQEDLERRVRTRPASSPSSRPPGSAASRTDHLLGSSSRAGLVPPRTAGV